MNHKDNFRYAEVATTNKSRIASLRYVYRHGTRAVGTDGHRLHIMMGLPEVEKPFMMTTDEGVTPDSFPNYEIALPTSEVLVCTFRASREEVKALKGLAAIAGGDCIVKLERKDGPDELLKFSWESRIGSQGFRTATIGLESDGRQARTPVSMWVDINYLVDAIIPSAEMELWQEANKKIVLKTSSTYAVIMGGV